MGRLGQFDCPNLTTFGKALNAIALPDGIGHNDPKDGVSAPRVLPSLYMVPTFWKADGYGRLVRHLKARFTLTSAAQDQAGNLLEFPYDWRLSNQLNAQQLSETATPVLERWRQSTKNPNAKLIFICHSMGGLVARHFLEVLGGRELTSKLITIGTPYQGSINALETLVNGLVLGVGPIGVSSTNSSVAFLQSTSSCRPTIASMSETENCAIFPEVTCRTSTRIMSPKHWRSTPRFHAPLRKHRNTRPS